MAVDNRPGPALHDRAMYGQAEPADDGQPAGYHVAGAARAFARAKRVAGVAQPASAARGTDDDGDADDRAESILLDSSEYEEIEVVEEEPGYLEAVRLPGAGSTVGKYQLIRELGRGGMGAVFLARDIRLGRLAAIKFLALRAPALVQRFIAEARATARCTHENIVVIYEVSEIEGIPYMALEYVEGKTLRQYMLEQRELLRSAAGGGSLLPAERVVELVIPIVQALERAHEMGIVHRDLKPENIMLTCAGTVKVLDFGIAKVLGEDEAAAPAAVAPIPRGRISSMTSTGVLVGTLPYMSPEQVRTQPADHRADIWAVGIMLFEMLTGKHPLAPLSDAELLGIGRSDSPMPKLSELRSDLGRLAGVVDRCLLKRREDRTESAQRLLAELMPLRPGRRDLILGIDECPFAGLAAFQESDADRFFGRNDDIAAVVALVRSHPLVAVIAPSGVGKSSLVRAGVIPALRHSGEGWEPLVIRPGRSPLGSLAGMLTQLRLRASTCQADPDGEASAGSGDVISDGPVSAIRKTVLLRLCSEPGYLGAELRTWAERKMRRLLIFVDQFEEIYTMDVDEEERAAFLACLAGLADDASSPLRVIFSMRSDFVERLAETREFMTAATRGLIFLPPIGRAGLRAALVRPIEAARYRFETAEMIESMLDALENTRGALPLLQFAAASLWEERDRGRRLLTEQSYIAMGGVAGTLARHADAVLAGMSARRVVLTRMIFERLVTPERTRAIASVSEMRELPGDSDEIEETLQDLASARLVVIEPGADAARMVEIVHESLIAGWPTLCRWLDENQEDSAFIARLRTAAAEWQKSGGAEGMLWRGDTEREARLWAERYQRELPERERRFLDAVFALADRVVLRKRIVVMATIVTLTLMVVAAAVALVWIDRAKREATRQAAIVQKQLDEIDEGRRAQARVEASLSAAEKKVRMSRVEIEAALEMERNARADAEREAREARRARDLARKSSKEAEELAIKERKLREELQRTQRRERERWEKNLKEAGVLHGELR